MRYGMPNWMDKIHAYDREEVMLAIRAAMSMAERFEEDMAVLHDLRVVHLATNDKPALEIIRYRGNAVRELTG